MEGAWGKDERHKELEEEDGKGGEKGNKEWVSVIRNKHQRTQNPVKKIEFNGLTIKGRSLPKEMRCLVRSNLT